MGRQVEFLLENYSTQLMDVSDRIDALQNKVHMHRTLEELKLRNERNRIMRSELLLSMSGLSLTVSAVIGGFFGMNLSSGIEELPGLLWLVGISGGCASAGLLYVLTAGVRRFHLSQSAHLVRMGSLQRGLESLDQAYYALRHTGILAPSHGSAEAGGGGREGAAAVLRSDTGAHGSRGDAVVAAVKSVGSDDDVRALREALALFDSDGDGMLSDDEVERLLNSGGGGDRTATGRSRDRS